MSKTGGFIEVVLMEFPRPDMRTVALVTNRVTDNSGREFLIGYVASTPNPTTGFMEIIPADEAISTDMTVEQATKMIVSGGMVSPPLTVPSSG
jgi:uncharacterized membrane protein